MVFILAMRVIFLLLVAQEYKMLCYQTHKRDAANDTIYIKQDVCLKTDENDTGCSFIPNFCNKTYQSCPLIQSELGVIMCPIKNLQENMDYLICFRNCHNTGVVNNKVVGQNPKCRARRTFEELNSRLTPFRFAVKYIDRFKNYVGSQNLPSDRACEALKVPASVCDVFTTNRVLLCGGSVWQQAQCYLGNCETDRWPSEVTHECRYAVVTNGVALCPSPQLSTWSCRFICLKNGTCSKTRYENTKDGRQLMFSDYNFKESDWETLESL